MRTLPASDTLLDAVAQAKTLSEFSDRVRWIPNLRKTTRIDGIIFSNELLDAMPVHRVRWDARQRKWIEW